MASYKASLSSYQNLSNRTCFSKKNRKALNTRGLHVIFNDVLKKAGLPPTRFTLHHFRHTFATLCYSKIKKTLICKHLKDYSAIKVLNEEELLAKFFTNYTLRLQLK
ncbi:tyrosine-type recombinase/integrase [Lysinibacillus sp. NPDC058147]|uniref:tyrosine-type recombinase/integrase n=1 Tax=unclassified Lysinibacillus TaxID=2636778 RepID=UPI0036DA68F7